MEGCNLIDTSFSRGEKVTKEMSPKTPKENKKITNVPYSTAFGNLMYSTMCTRPNICYVVGMVSRFQENPRMMHWKVIKRILSCNTRSCEVEKFFAKPKNNHRCF
ncbi:hypothetical protein AAG906_037485 [Vitis piasezkii]